MTQSRTELIDIVGRILASGDWDDPNIDNCDIGSKADVRAYAEEIVTALRPDARDYRYVHANGEFCGQPGVICAHG